MDGLEDDIVSIILDSAGNRHNDGDKLEAQLSQTKSCGAPCCIKSYS